LLIVLAPFVVLVGPLQYFFLGHRAMCEVVKVKIDFHFISPCPWLRGGEKGGWAWGKRGAASVIFVGTKNASLTAAIYEACFMNEFFRIGRTIFPSISFSIFFLFV